ncbi:MAG: class I SAM-dependent methyltransferase [Gemmatimonadales bacterium]
MGFYERRVLPWVIHLACSARPIAKQRAKVIPFARGRVLEIGIGSGLNLPFYDAARVERLLGLDPSPQMRRMAAKAAARAAFDVDFVSTSSEEIALDDESVDTVVTTYTLCTIPDAVRALRETARVLKPGGRLLFCEHGLAPDASVRRWQHRANTWWGRIGGGCNLDRDIPALLKDGGFRVERLETAYVAGWRPASFTYWGSATPG